MGGLILIKIVLVGMGRLLGSGLVEGGVDPCPLCSFYLDGLGLRMNLSGDDLLIPQIPPFTFPSFL